MKNQTGIAHVFVAGLLAVVLVIAGAFYLLQKRSSDAGDTSQSSTTQTEVIAETTESDEDAVKREAKEHFKLVYAQKIDESYAMTCQEFKENTSLEVYEPGLKNGGFFTIDLSGIDYTQVDIGNNQAVIQGAVGPLQPDAELEVKLLKKDNGWCILGYSTI